MTGSEQPPRAQRLRATDLHPQLRRTFRLVPNPPVRRRWTLALMQAGGSSRRPPRVLQGVGHRYVDLADGRGAGVHVFTPAGARPRAAVLWVHGGGMVVGSAAQDHARCVALARDLDLVVVSAEYRLAPGHPYPAPLDDVHAAWTWVLEHADEIGVDPARVAVGGQSAGGGLAAGLVLRVHDEGGPQPAAQWLFCPMLDDRTAADRSHDAVRHYVWNNASNRAGWSAYLGDAPGGDDVPAYAAPARRTDLSGLPPAWVGVGDVDLFHAEDADYARRLSDAGVPCVLDVVPGGPHALESLAADAPVSREYRTRAEDWLAARLGVARPSGEEAAPVA
ncbi:alpha/beta hydrolase [Cellulomonas sp. SLBN-39]|uniref:alpha/beta hydrolase n=1 Tax=Cellulomonas sp. SLBN-39 TaxID=2768446 RepID=UPI001171D57B|nr:alpha/beta hydrolase [Cellulomonas sp. SLBN-39]TQL02289.1 acetyl esterase/lipase [Cellulomonas sp. SLBN-39]